MLVADRTVTPNAPFTSSIPIDVAKAKYAA